MKKVDVLMCVGPQDIDRLFVESLRSCFQNFSLLSQLYIVTPNPALVREKIGLLPVTILADEEVLPSSLQKEDGWYKQQVIKLQACHICKSRYVACLSADTLLLQPIDESLLFSERPILYYRSYDRPSPHFEYEKLRLNAIERILQAPLPRARSYVDFILDFTIWDTKILRELNRYLKGLYGEEAYKVLSPGRCDTLEKKREFGEWSLYAAFVLDVLREPVEVRGFDEKYFFQIHSEKDFRRFEGDAKIVHFVSKNLRIAR